MGYMQRLFGTFPNRGAGLALVVLRLAVALVLVTRVWLCPALGATVLMALSAVAAFLITVGLFTPIASGSAALLSLGFIRFSSEPFMSALMIAILVAVALLGAGAYSVDARLYGRRRLVISSTKDKLS
jgi:uncharacterized membrane protein YphA (DoxX/SURF4 family)